MPLESERFLTQDLKRGSCFGLVLAAGMFSNGYPRQYYGVVYRYILLLHLNLPNTIAHNVVPIITRLDEELHTL